VADLTIEIKKMSLAVLEECVKDHLRLLPGISCDRFFVKRAPNLFV
jgi:hypothetical protein